MIFVKHGEQVLLWLLFEAQEGGVGRAAAAQCDLCVPWQQGWLLHGFGRSMCLSWEGGGTYNQGDIEIRSPHQAVTGETVSVVQSQSEKWPEPLL